MTVKTHRVIAMLENTANWPSTNFGTATALGGSTWDGASSDETTALKFAVIRKTVQSAAVKIVLLTNGAVRPEDLRVIISPPLAMMLGSTGEIYNYVKSSPFSQARQEGRNQLNEQYGMPQYYAGVEWVIEDSPIVYSEYPASVRAASIGATGRAFIKNDTTAIIVSRKGGLNGVYGAPSFSTVQMFYYRFEMSVEEMHDVWNKKHRGRVVDQFAEVLTASRAGYVITGVWPTAIPMLAEMRGGGEGPEGLEAPKQQRLPAPDETPEEKDKREHEEEEARKAQEEARKSQEAEAKRQQEQQDRGHGPGRGRR